MVMHARILFVIVWILLHAINAETHENKVQEMAYRNVQCQQAFVSGNRFG